MLYKNRGMHRKALELLYEKGQQKVNCSSVIKYRFVSSRISCDIPLQGRLSGPFNTVQYLERLGAEHIDLILEFSKWILTSEPEEGFSIFISEDYPETAELPQEKVLAHLEANAPQFVVRYESATAVRAGQCSDASPPTGTLNTL